MFRKFPCTFKMWWEKLDEFFPGQCVYISLLPKLFKRPKLTVGVKLLPAISASFLAHVPQCTKFLFVKIFLWQVKPGGRKEVKNSTPTVHANFQDWKFHISYIARSKERKLCFVTRNVSETGLSFFKASKKNLRSSDHYRWFLMKRCQMFLWGAPNPLKAVPADFGQSSIFLQ